MGSPEPVSDPGCRGPGGGWRRLARPGAAVVGCVLLLSGLVVLGRPVAEAWWRDRSAGAAAASWPVASERLVGAVPGDLASPAPTPSPGPPECVPASNPADYALVVFNGLDRYGYRGVAADGTWDLLGQRSMVHHRSTPAPGQQGNVVIAFHREPAYLHIDELQVGDLVTLEDRGCHSWIYRITQQWQLSPGKVDQLGPTSGHDLTLVTCAPWYQDTQRLVWRGSLWSPAGLSTK